MSKNIVDIKVELLFPHPKNPRLDVGDVSELAESIKTKGILQNLTVIKGGPGVPEGQEGYTVIIGHRRRAGAIAAGVDTVPCAVVEMSETEQVSTMLLENMQRTDLTVYEQAQGIQAMMDLGETVKTISEKTGFSASTIDRRRKLLNLDKDTFKESASRGATLDDYLKVSEIEDEAERNKVLSHIGTNNFDYQLKTALEDQKKRKLKEKIMAVIPENVVICKIYSELPEYYERETVDSVYYYNPLSDERIQEIAKIFSDNETYYIYDNGYSMTIYKKVAPKENTAKEETEAQRKNKERIAKLNELRIRCINLRKEFLEDFKPTKAKTDKIIKFVAMLQNMDGGYGYDVADVCKKVGVSFDEEDGEYEKLIECVNKDALATLFYSNIYSLNDENLYAHMSWSGEYNSNYELKNLYSALQVLGYQMSDDEKAYIDGSHSLYEEVETDD